MCDIFAGRNYRAPCRPYKDDPTRIRYRFWYTVPFDRQAIPIENTFCTTKDEVCPVHSVGEISGQREYGNFAAPHLYLPGFGGAPPRWCGSADQWLHGPLTTDPILTTNPLTHTSLCCGPAGVLCTGGVADGGRGQVVSRALGGVAAGGRGQVVSRALGGVADGGNERFDHLDLGGVAGGGTTIVFHAHAGGVAGGGTSTAAAYELAGGGVADGGTSTAAAFELAAGGVADGGTSTAAAFELTAGGVAGGGLGRDVLMAYGGVADGGTTQAPITMVSCASFTGGRAAYQWKITLAGVTNNICSDCNNLNTTFVLTNVSTCQWSSGNFTLCGSTCHWMMVATGSGPASFALGVVGVGLGSWQFTGSNDGRSNLTMTNLLPGTNCSSVPATITVIPL